MTAAKEIQSPSAETLKVALPAARATAVAAGVFVALVVAMLVANHFRGKRYDLVEPPPEFASGKKAVLEQTESEEAERLKDDLRLRIRELDLRIREESFRRD